MSSAVCTHCGSSDIDKDSARGDAVCTNCGSVLEDQIIVSEIQFAENAVGGSSMVGQYVSAEGNKAHSMGSGFHNSVGKESRMITLQNGKRRLQQLGDQLRLNQHCIDTAFNFYKMAVSRRLTRGRKSTHVLAACLYLVCRTEGTPHMLLDFADVLQTSVYQIGRTYLQLSRELCINIPALDPCLYIPRFAHKLEFGEKTHEVSMTALRLVSRMTRDWMAQGRRPSGLCGAALLVASRIHEFNRTIKEMIKVVKIGEGTIRKRLAEFEQTPSSQLTVDEFQKIDLEEEMDPPCFSAGKRRLKLQQLEEQGQLPQLTSEIAALQQKIESALEDANEKRSKKQAMTGKDTDTSSVCSCLSDVDDELASCNKLIEHDTLKEIVAASSHKGALSKETQQNISNPDRDSGGDHPLPHDVDPAVAMLEQQELDNLIMPPPEVSLASMRPTAATIGITETIQACMSAPVENEAEDGDGELDLSGIDDEEIDKLILTDEEVKRKTLMWIRANAEYLKEMREKAENEARMQALGIVKPEKKKKRARKKQVKIEAQSAGEAIEKMLQEKKISSKINYDVLKDLNKASESTRESTSENTTAAAAVPSAASLFSSGTIEATPVNIKSRFKRPNISLETTSSATREKLPAKRIKTEPKSSVKVESSVETQVEAKPVVQEVIVESGPVDYTEEDDAELEDEDRGDYYEEEEEEHISAASLLGHGNMEDYQDDGYDYDE